MIKIFENRVKNSTVMRTTHRDVKSTLKVSDLILIFQRLKTRQVGLVLPYTAHSLSILGERIYVEITLTILFAKVLRSLFYESARILPSL